MKWGGDCLQLWGDAWREKEQQPCLFIAHGEVDE